MPIVVIGLSHHSAPVGLRERFAFADAGIPASLQRLRESGVAEEAVILSTCNRVEIYAATEREPAKAFHALKEFLASSHGYREPLKDEIYAFSEPRSIQHLFNVACGLDSMVLGETEILGQLKKAYGIALAHGHTGRCLNRAFQKAFSIAKQIRTETNIQRGNVSVASVAVELAERIFASLDDRCVMVIGAGDTGEKAVRALRSRGVRDIIVANRSPERAEALAGELGGRAMPFDDFEREFERTDIVISSTAAPHHILDRAKLAPLMRLRRNRPLLLIDIAVPRDIDPEVNHLEGVFLYNIDDLQTIADDCLRQRKEELVRCEEIICEKAKALLGHTSTHRVPPSTRPAFGHE
jgi:glutamyl-tRNA reductase